LGEKGVVSQMSVRWEVREGAGLRLLMEFGGEDSAAFVEADIVEVCGGYCGRAIGKLECEIWGSCDGRY
jgi:hypothetical protein